MQKFIKYVRLPFLFDTDRLQSDLFKIDKNWIAHLNKQQYSGDWGAIPLRSKGGRVDDIVPHVNEEDEFIDTKVMEQCAYIKEVVNILPGVKKAVRLMNLKSGALIKEHRDHDLCYEKGEARIHIPITTNENVEFLLDGEKMKLNVGECWYMNFNLPHSLVNNGDSDRVHLVIDCIVDDEMQKLFESEEIFKTKKVVEIELYSAEERKMIIDRLRELGTETAMKIADAMSTIV
jgi:hypothetical protein